MGEWVDSRDCGGEGANPATAHSSPRPPLASSWRVEDLQVVPELEVSAVSLLEGVYGPCSNVCPRGKLRAGHVLVLVNPAYDHLGGRGTSYLSHDRLLVSPYTAIRNIWRYTVYCDTMYPRRDFEGAGQSGEQLPEKEVDRVGNV